MLVHLQSFSSNPSYYTIPESAKNGVPLFYLPPNSNNPVSIVKRYECKGLCKRSQHCWAFAHHVVCCCVLLRLVGSCWMKFETGQTSEPTSANISIVSRSSKRGPTMLRSFAQHIQQCCAGARALQTGNRVVCMELWVFVSQSPLYSHLKTQHVVTCCERATRHNNVGPTMLPVVASVCTGLK